MENEIKEQENVDTATTDVEETQTENGENEKGLSKENPSDDTPKTFTQEQVNDFVRNRVDRIYKRYGVTSTKDLDALIDKSKSYEMMEERYNQMANDNSSLREELAFIKNNVNPERYDDVRAYFKGKSLEFTNDSLVNELSTHPEWLNVVKNDTPKTTIQSLGGDNKHHKPERDEKAEAMRLFGLQ